MLRYATSAAVRAPNRHRPLGELLIEAGVLTGQQLEYALRQQRHDPRPLGQVLVAARLVSEDAMVSTLSRQLQIPAVQLHGRQLSRSVLSLLDAHFCRHFSCIAFRYRREGNTLDVAMADPTVSDVYEALRKRTRCQVRPFIAAQSAIDATISAAYEDALDDPTETGSPTGVRSPLGVDNHSGVRTAERIGVEPSAELSRLRAEVVELRQMLERDEGVLRRLLGLIVDKGVCGRDELLARLNQVEDSR